MHRRESLLGFAMCAGLALCFYLIDSRLSNGNPHDLYCCCCCRCSGRLLRRNCPTAVTASRPAALTGSGINNRINPPPPHYPPTTLPLPSQLPSLLSPSSPSN